MQEQKCMLVPAFGCQVTALAHVGLVVRVSHNVTQVLGMQMTGRLHLGRPAHLICALPCTGPLELPRTSGKMHERPFLMHNE